MNPDNSDMREFVRELTEHQQALRSFVGYLMAGSAGVQDVVQEVNLLLWEKRDRFEPGTNFRAWAFTTARYAVLGQRRRMRKQGVLVFDDELIDQLADEWEEDVDEGGEEMLEALDRCLSALSESDLHLLRRRYAKHGNIEKEAARSGQTAGSMRIRLFRLRAALKQCVLRELAEGRGMA